MQNSCNRKKGKKGDTVKRVLIKPLPTFFLRFHKAKLTHRAVKIIEKTAINPKRFSSSEKK